MEDQTIPAELISLAAVGSIVDRHVGVVPGVANARPHIDGLILPWRLLFSHCDAAGFAVDRRARDVLDEVRGSQNACRRQIVPAPSHQVAEGTEVEVQVLVFQAECRLQFVHTIAQLEERLAQSLYLLIAQ